MALTFTPLLYHCDLYLFYIKKNQIKIRAHKSRRIIFGLALHKAVWAVDIPILNIEEVESPYVHSIISQASTIHKQYTLADFFFRHSYISFKCRTLHILVGVCFVLYNKRHETNINNQGQCLCACGL